MTNTLDPRLEETIRTRAHRARDHRVEAAALKAGRSPRRLRARRPSGQSDDGRTSRAAVAAPPPREASGTADHR